MKIYIQSKSGDLNTVVEATLECENEFAALDFLRRAGAYPAKHRGEWVAVPFEEIQFVRKAVENETSA